MKNRRNWLSIVRWTHNDNGFALPWPFLHCVSLCGRTALVCEFVCPFLLLAFITFVQERPMAENLSRLAAIQVPMWFWVALLVPPTLFVLDQLMRFRLQITPEQVELRRPWGTSVIFPRNNLKGVQVHYHEIGGTFEKWPRHISFVQLILQHPDGTRQRLGVGGAMRAGIAADLIREIGLYTRIR